MLSYKKVEQLPLAGLEPARPKGRRDLNATRLPIPSQRRGVFTKKNLQDFNPRHAGRLTVWRAVNSILNKGGGTEAKRQNRPMSFSQSQWNDLKLEWALPERSLTLNKKISLF